MRGRRWSWVLLSLGALLLLAGQPGEAAQKRDFIDDLLQPFRELEEALTDDRPASRRPTRHRRERRDEIGFFDRIAFGLSPTRDIVRNPTRQKAGTIVVNTKAKNLYYVLRDGRALRYRIGVGREGYTWRGVTKVGRKEEWPSWRPPPAMLERRPNLPRYMPGGVRNPLGARALYLHAGGRDTLYRIHGTNDPRTIGRNMSSGCIRMMNEDVEDLYERVRLGTRVVVK